MKFGQPISWWVGSNGTNGEHYVSIRGHLRDAIHTVAWLTCLRFLAGYEPRLNYRTGTPTVYQETPYFTPNTSKDYNKVHLPREPRRLKNTYRGGNCEHNEQDTTNVADDLLWDELWKECSPCHGNTWWTETSKGTNSHRKNFLQAIFRQIISMSCVIVRGASRGSPIRKIYHKDQQENKNPASQISSSTP